MRTSSERSLARALFACAAAAALAAPRAAGLAGPEGRSSPAAPSAREEKTPPAAQSGGRESLQTLLARLRAQRATVLAEKRAGFDVLLAELDQRLAAKDDAALAETRKKLVALGPESAPLLADGLDPGPQPSGEAKKRSQALAQALCEMPTRSVTDRLLELVRKGSPDGQQNALFVLSKSPEPERVGPTLVAMWPKSEGPLRHALLGALAGLGGPHAEQVISESLASSDSQTVRATLQALAAAHNVAAAPKVLAQLDKARDSARVEGVLAYYRACPEAADKSHLVGLVRIAQDFSVPTELRTRILAALPSLSERVDTEVKKELRSIAEAPTGEVREAALVALYVFGEKSARRDLVAPYDDQIDHNKTWHQNWDARASILYRIGEYRDALKDWQQALKLAADDPRAKADPYWLGTARCQAQLGKYKDAAQALERTGLTLRQLAELAREPAFAKMAKDPKFKGVFRIE